MSKRTVSLKVEHRSGSGFRGWCLLEFGGQASSAVVYHRLTFFRGSTETRAECNRDVNHARPPPFKVQSTLSRLHLAAVSAGGQREKRTVRVEGSSK